MIESRSIQGVLVVIVVAVLAAWLGVAIVTEQTETLLKVAGISLLAICLLLGRRVWLLMVFFTAMEFPLIRGFSTVELGQGLFVAFSLLMISVRQLRLKRNFGEPEVWILMIALLVVQAYLRNPVGLNMFGASAVGAKPYFVIALSFLSGCLMSILVVPQSELKWAARLSVLGTFIAVPFVEWRTRYAYAAMAGETGFARIAGLGSASSMGLRWLVSKMSPYQAILRPLYLFLFLVFIVAAAGSGYRNYVAYAGLTLLVGIFYHHGFFVTLASTFAAALLIGALAVVNLVAPLPGNIQRALSPFPGTWEKRYVDAAENSTEWRVEMWKEALFTDRWIRNKALGDGLGITREEHRRMESLAEGGRDAWAGSTGLTVQQENMMLAGGYHSGPVHTIRTVGYVGLVVILLAMIRIGTQWHRLLKRARGTPWFSTVLFFAIPALVLPLQFTFIFGEFHTACAILFFSFGLIRLTTNNLSLLREPTPAVQIQPSMAARKGRVRAAMFPTQTP